MAAGTGGACLGRRHALSRASRAAIIAGAVLLFIALGIGADHLFWWPGWFGGPLVMLALLGAAIWWLSAAATAAGRHRSRAASSSPSPSSSRPSRPWGSASGRRLGGGAAVAGLLVVAGLGIMAAAFAGGARWLIAPAIALALGTGIATAADVDLRGDDGERTETPRSLADLPEAYDMGAGSLIVDLREVEFPAGETTLRVEVGVGEAVLVVPPDLCVVPDSHVGVGELAILGRRQEGIDLDRRDTALATDRRLAVDAEVGIGSLRITTDPDEAYRDDDRWDDRFDGRDGDCDCATADRANAACIAGTQG